MDFDSSMFALYVWQKKTTFEIQILTYSNIKVTHTNKLAEFKELHRKLWQGLMTVCVSLCAIRKCPHIIMLRWFVKIVLLTLSFEPLFWCRHDVPLNDWIESTNSCRKKLIWVQFNQMKPPLSILHQIPQVDGCSSNRLSRTRTSGPKTHFLHVKKSIALNEF